MCCERGLKTSRSDDAFYDLRPIETPSLGLEFDVLTNLLDVCMYCVDLKLWDERILREIMCV